MAAAATRITLIAEAAKIYRQARDKKMDHAEARSLVWMLAQMRAMVETRTLERLEQRLKEILLHQSKAELMAWRPQYSR
jgi:hypothetical protein